MTSRNIRAPFLYYYKFFASFQSHRWIVSWNYSSEMLNSGQNRRFSVLRDLEIWKMTLKNNRAPLPCYLRLCASFESHRWIQTGVAVRKRSIRVKIADYFSCVTLKFDRRPWKTIGHLFFATSSFVHHFKAISQLKLEFQCGNAKFGSKSAIFCVTLEFDGWPWKTIGHLFYDSASFVHHFVAIGEFKLELQSGNAQIGQNRRLFEPRDLEIWRMTSKNNRAPLLSNIKVCTSFHHHMSIQTGLTVRKCLNWLLTSVTVTLTLDLWPWPFAWTSFLSLVITPENFMMMPWGEHSEKGVTDRQTDGQTEPFIELLGRS